MSKVKVTQIRSAIDRPKKQKDTLRILGLKKMNQTIEVEVNPSTQGMLNVVSHLVRIED